MSTKDIIICIAARCLDGELVCPACMREILPHPEKEHSYCPRCLETWFSPTLRRRARAIISAYHEELCKTQHKLDRINSYTQKSGRAI